MLEKNNYSILNDGSLPKQVTVIGGGAAGLAAAISAARLAGGNQVRMIEKNEKLGRKILATGNGRCNFTNSYCSDKDFDSSLSKGESFVKTAFSQFGVQDTLGFFRGLGILPREEAEGRMYPYSEQAAAVQEALQSEAEALGVEIIYHKTVKNIKKETGGKGAAFTIELESGESFCSQKVVLATGGKAGIQYGSSGEGYQLTKAFGHTINKPIPALVPLLSDDPLIKHLKGIRAKGRVSLCYKKKEIASETGEIQFTGEGLSGICVFNLSRYIRLKDSDCYHDFSVQIDLFPELDSKALLEHLLLRRKVLKSRKKEDFFNGLIQQNIALAIYSKLDIAPSGTAGELTDELLKELSEILNNWEIALSGTKGWKEAQVTSGGLETSEIDPTTMESKLVKGLYLAGELIDVDAKCGGYNLQWAWTSGMIAGTAAAQTE